MKKAHKETAVLVLGTVAAVLLFKKAIAPKSSSSSSTGTATSVIDFTTALLNIAG